MGSIRAGLHCSKEHTTPEKLLSVKNTEYYISVTIIFMHHAAYLDTTQSMLR